MLAWRTATYAPNPWAAGAGLAMLCALDDRGHLGLARDRRRLPLQAATSLVLGLAVAGAATVEENTAV